MRVLYGAYRKLMPDEVSLIFLTGFLGSIISGLTNVFITDRVGFGLVSGRTSPSHRCKTCSRDCRPLLLGLFVSLCLMPCSL